jgi:hypothetical protein
MALKDREKSHRPAAYLTATLTPEDSALMASVVAAGRADRSAITARLAVVSGLSAQSAHPEPPFNARFSSPKLVGPPRIRVADAPAPIADRRPPAWQPCLAVAQALDPPPGQLGLLFLRFPFSQFFSRQWMTP